MSRTSIAPSKQKKSEPVGSTREASGRRERSAQQQKLVPDGMDKYEMIATAAYYRAESRGFNGGNPVDDWLMAEAEINQLYH